MSFGGGKSLNEDISLLELDTVDRIMEGRPSMASSWKAHNPPITEELSKIIGSKPSWRICRADVRPLAPAPTMQTRRAFAVKPSLVIILYA